MMWYDITYFLKILLNIPLLYKWITKSQSHRHIYFHTWHKNENSFEYDKSLKENLLKQDLKNIFENKN
jgi:hypothetical protein